VIGWQLSRLEFSRRGKRRESLTKGSVGAWWNVPRKSGSTGQSIKLISCGLSFIIVFQGEGSGGEGLFCFIRTVRVRSKGRFWRRGGMAAAIITIKRWNLIGTLDLIVKQPSVALGWGPDHEKRALKYLEERDNREFAILYFEVSEN
jgi:hypothetical protein